MVGVPIQGRSASAASAAIKPLRICRVARIPRYPDLQAVSNNRLASASRPYNRWDGSMRRGRRGVLLVNGPDSDRLHDPIDERSANTPLAGTCRTVVSRHCTRFAARPSSPLVLRADRSRSPSRDEAATTGRPVEAPARVPLPFAHRNWRSPPLRTRHNRRHPPHQVRQSRLSARGDRHWRGMTACLLRFSAPCSAARYDGWPQSGESTSWSGCVRGWAATIGKGALLVVIVRVMPRLVVGRATDTACLLPKP